MDLNRIQAFLADAAAAAPANGTVEDPRALQLKTFIPLIGFAFIFYFVLIRPQQKKAKEQQELLKSVKAGDKVSTSSGIIGVIVTVKEKTVTIRSADTKLELSKSAITEIAERGTATVES